MTDRHEMEAVAEAILFVANEPVPRAKLLEVFSESQREAAEAALEAVIERYREDPVRGVMIDEAAGGLRLVSRPDLHGYLRRFFEVTGSTKLTMAALETLAIIAYRQPITSPEIQELRTVNSAGVLKTLLERRLIRIAGRKEVVGKPFLYATTREFLMRFGLRSLKELPPLEQFDELFGGEDEPAPEFRQPDTEEEILQEVAAVEEAEAEREDEAEESEESDGSEEAEESDRSDGSEEAEESDRSDKSDGSDGSDGSDKSDGSEEADGSDGSEESAEPEEAPGPEETERARVAAMPASPAEGAVEPEGAAEAER